MGGHQPPLTSVGGGLQASVHSLRAGWSGPQGHSTADLAYKRPAERGAHIELRVEVSVGRLVDLTGQRFGRLTVLALHPERGPQSRAIWICQCDCGRTKAIRSGSLRNGATQSCGLCNYTDITGRRYGRLLVLRVLPEKTKAGALLWRCLCDCGTYIRTRSDRLKTGITRSCGCYQRDSMTTKPRRLRHGASTAGEITPEYIAYGNAKARCSNPNRSEWEHYGGRGIEFRFGSFEEFFAELGLRPSPDRSVDRINNNGHYEPGNVRWATRDEQARNRRPKRKGDISRN